MIVDFNTQSTLEDWRVVDDVVMGGISDSQFFIDRAGHGNFTGSVSLENNGGFCSIRYNAPKMYIKDYSRFVIRLKGDGKRYQFRVKKRMFDRATYVKYFDTTGDWQTIEIKMEELYPSWRGQRLEGDNYDGRILGQLGFLIANYKAESFQLKIDKIYLE